MAKNKLSIYLIREDITSTDDIFETDVVELRRYTDDKCAYYKPSYIHSPPWLRTFFIEDHDDLSQANSKVILLVKRNYDGVSRIFAITFGFAKNLFKENVLEERFGLKIVLNSASETELRKISKLNIGGNHKQSQEQIPKSGRITEFGFDIDRDLIRSVTAKSHEETFEKNILTGSDIFSITVERDVRNIEEFLDFCYTKYLDTSYRTRFDWVDNINEVRNKTVIDSLNSHLISLIINQDFEHVWMAVPDIVTWENISGFKYGRMNHNDIYIEKVIEWLGEDRLDTSKFKSTYIKAISAIDGREEYKWSVYNCIIAEFELDGNSYCLNNGKWFQIDRDYVVRITQDYDRIPISALSCIDYDAHDKEVYNEDIYNEELSQSIPSCALVHKIGEIPFGGGTGNRIEVCDIMTPAKQLLHIKKGESSSHLSHLFNQATVSAEMLLDPSFRAQCIQKLTEHELPCYFDDEFKTGDYTIVIGIINKNTNERPKIPFFSRVSIRYAARTLSNMGYPVEIKNIINRSA